MEKLTGAGHPVKCPKCKRHNVYVTTEAYDPDKTPDGSMLRLVNRNHCGGMTYGNIAGSPRISSATMECCDCMGQLCSNGQKIEIYQAPEVAPDPRTPEGRQALIDEEAKSFMPEETPDMALSPEIAEEANREGWTEGRPPLEAEQPAPSDKIPLGNGLFLTANQAKHKPVCPYPGCGQVCKTLNGLKAHIKAKHKE